MKKIRVALKDEYLVPTKGVEHVGREAVAALVPVSRLHNLRIIAKPVQDWLLANVGYPVQCRNALDRYYYEGEERPSPEEVASAPRILKDQRRWSVGLEKLTTGKSERFIYFNGEDEDKAMAFLLMFGSKAVRRRSKPAI